MILAVMTRASLGHTGRPLTISRAITAAYVFLTLGAALRVFSPIFGSDSYVSVISIAGACWTIAFLLYIVVYSPILTLPRADGKPG
jgi:uncharacterized protein involved in response to NO